MTSSKQLLLSCLRLIIGGVVIGTVDRTLIAMFWGIIGGGGAGGGRVVVACGGGDWDGGGTGGCGNYGECGGDVSGLCLGTVHCLVEKACLCSRLVFGEARGDDLYVEEGGGGGGGGREGEGQDVKFVIIYLGCWILVLFHYYYSFCFYYWTIFINFFTPSFIQSVSQ